MDRDPGEWHWGGCRRQINRSLQWSKTRKCYKSIQSLNLNLPVPLLKWFPFLFSSLQIKNESFILLMAFPLEIEHLCEQNKPVLWRDLSLTLIFQLRSDTTPLLDIYTGIFLMPIVKGFLQIALYSFQHSRQIMARNHHPIDFESISLWVNGMSGEHPTGLERDSQGSPIDPGVRQPKAQKSLTRVRPSLNTLH